MNVVRLVITKWPRTVAAITFGGLTMTVTHFAWVPETRMSGWAPALTLAAGLAHALAGAFTGKRLLDKRRTRTSLEACALGAVTSLFAQLCFAPWFSLWVNATNNGSNSIWSYVAMTLWIAVFSFLAIGWALLLVSAGAGWGLYRLVVTRHV